MARLSAKQRSFVVSELARLRTPTEVAKAVKEAFGIEVTLQQVQHYDPTTVQGQACAERWKDLFWEVRERFLEEVANIAIAHRVYRLERLQRIVDHPVLSKNPRLVMDALKQAAQEVGDVFTNTREVSGKGGGSIVVEVYGDRDGPGEGGA